MRYLILILFINIVNINLFAQNLTDSINPNNKFRKNAVFVEVRNARTFTDVSINYNRTFIKKEKFLLNGSIGTNIIYMGQDMLVSLRLSASINWFETGIYIINTTYYATSGRKFDDYKYIFKFEGGPILGYRYQKKFLFRVSFTPLLVHKSYKYYSGPCCGKICIDSDSRFSLSFGYCF